MCGSRICKYHDEHGVYPAYAEYIPGYQATLRMDLYQKFSKNPEAIIKIAFAKLSNQFFISYRKTKLKRSEFIYSIKIPLNRQNVFKAYKISKRFDDDISSVCGSFSFLIKKNRITKVAIAYGGMSEIPKRALTIEKNLINSEFSENTFSRAVDLMNKDFSPLDDMRASKNYRLTVAKNLLLKAFYEINDKKNIRIHS